MSTPHLLPVELLCLVFSYLPLKDRIGVTHVCRAWRSIALDAKADLWSQIKCCGRPDILRAHLERAGALKIDLCIELVFREVDYDSVFELIAQHMHRVRTLILFISNEEKPCDDEPPEIFYERVEALVTGVAAPVLEFLDLDMPLVIEQPLFLGVTPKLVWVNSRDVQFQAKGCHESVLTLIFNSEVISLPSHVQHIFDMFPSLESLELSADHFRTDWGWSPHEPQAPIPPYTRLVLSGNFPLSLPSYVMDCIPLERLQEVEYRIISCHLIVRSPFPQRELVSMLQFKTGLFLAFEYTQDKQSVIVLTESSGVKRAFQVNTRTIQPKIMAFIVSLKIFDRDLFAWHTTEDSWWYALELPHIMLLSIFVAELEDYTEDKGWRSLMMAGKLLKPGPLSRAPELSGLLISSSSDAKCPSMDPETICDFIEYHLSGTVDRPLRHLGFYNLPLLENRPEAVARMTRLASDIYYDPEEAEWEHSVSATIFWDEPDIDFD